MASESPPTNRLNQPTPPAAEHSNGAAGSERRRGRVCRERSKPWAYATVELTPALAPSGAVDSAGDSQHRMPDLGTQAKLDGVFTADLTVVRALLRRGRPYDKAVETFEPYDRIQEPNESAPEGMRMIVKNALKSKKSAFVFVNNQLEGNEPSTIEAVVERIDARSSATE